MFLVGTETDFLPNFSLFYTHKGRKKLYELLGVNSHKEFMETMQTLQTGKGISEDLYAKITYAGLIYKHPELTLEDMDEILEKYALTGKGFEDLDNTIIDAFVNSGLYDGKLIAMLRKLKENQFTDEGIEDALNKLVQSKVADMGGLLKAKTQEPITAMERSPTVKSL